MNDMRTIDYSIIIKQAWAEFDPSKEVKAVFDVSAKVSTNHVFKVTFYDRNPVFAKLSYYGEFAHFKEDHVIINNLANNLESPYENFLARSLVKKNEVFIYRFKQEYLDAWVIFYNPIKIKKKMPRRLEEKHIVKLGAELALFHKACMNVRNSLPTSSKTLVTDIKQLTKTLNMFGSCACNPQEHFIHQQCDLFLENSEKLNYSRDFQTIPVFVDWNIGNFSVTSDGRFYSRWDYDWFRMASRVMDFYFFSRVVSDIGDRTVFSYLVDPLMEDRFILFLKEYHSVFPLTEPEVRFMKEAYRFFILNYVIKDGRYFFHEIYANKLQREAFELYFPSLEQKFDAEKLLRALKL
jgi:hypothetical protein